MADLIPPRYAQQADNGGSEPLGQGVTPLLLGNGGLSRSLHSYDALLPARDAPERRSSQCRLVSTARHFLAFLNF